jgi:7-cyano-7-deazaguanine synthase in queuosine biosynthesis
LPSAIVELSDTQPSGEALYLRPGSNLVTGEAQFASFFGTPTTLECDLFTLASAIYACDLAMKRGERELIARQIDISIPVTNLHAFNSVLGEIRYALYVLGHDAWRINFTAREGLPEPATPWPMAGDGKILLFSGGLDSFAAAVRLGEASERVHLVSHVTANPTLHSAQESLFKYLQGTFLLSFDRFAFRVGGRTRPKDGLPFPADHAREDTQRTRSFLFLSLAALVARRLGTPDIIFLAENGQMAIHLPLTTARIGAFSTHTAHPEFIGTMARLLSHLLSYPLTIENPFLYSTKAEVIRPVVDRHSGMLDHAISCWRSARIGAGDRHCGTCIPCLVRRIALEVDGARPDEYQRDILSEDISRLPPDDEGKRNLIDLAEFVRSFEAAQNQAALESAFPDLVSQHFDGRMAAQMYLRFAAEARVVFGKYPLVREVLS